MYLTGSGPFGEASGTPVPVAVETFHALKERQSSENLSGTRGGPGRVNLLNWDGQGSPQGLFPPDATPPVAGAGEEWA